MEKEPKSFLFRFFTKQKAEEPEIREEFSIPMTSKGKIFSKTDEYGIVRHFFGVSPEEKKIKDSS